METKKSTTAVLSAIIVILAVATGTLLYFNKELKSGKTQLLDVHRSLSAERDTLNTGVQTRQERIGLLDTELKSLQQARDAQAAEVKQLSTSVAESRQALDGAMSELNQLSQNLQDARQQQKTLSADKEALTQQLAQAQEQAKASAETNATLTRDLDAAKRSVDEGQARVAELNKATEQLQAKVSKLEAADSARQAELKQLRQTGQETEQQLQALNAEKQALAQKLTTAQGQAKTSAAAGATLTRDLDAAKRSLDEGRARAAELNKANEQLQAKYSKLETADTARQAELNRQRQLGQDAQQRLQALGSEKQMLAQRLSGAQEQAKAATAAGADLSRDLDSTQQTLAQARARAAELNKSYELLLRKHSKLAVTNEARRADLARAKAAFEEAQTEVARLTGARGIYTVQNGDSLSSIAAYFYRNGHRWPDINRENEFLGGNADLIYAGQVLIVPQ